MEEQKTVKYTRSLRGSIGAGVNALFNGEGRRYYILEYRDSSGYYKAGQQQKIIVDQAEMGRGSGCQVKFDESFKTVSRRHAVIVRDGDRWKLVPLSTTNTTFLNGRPLETESYLENGDEIQLSVGGPRLGFIVLAGKQSLVSSIKMTERFNLFRKQALRPYKRAIVAMCVIIVGLVIWGSINTIKIIDLDNKKAELMVKIQELEKKDSTNVAEIDTLNKKLVKLNDKAPVIKTIVKYVSSYTPPKPRVLKDSLKKDDPKSVGTDELAKCMKDVYSVTVTPLINEKPIVLADGSVYYWTGTGFLLDNGCFVTAQHMVNYNSIGVSDGELNRDDARNAINAGYYASLIRFRMTCTSSKGDTFGYTYSYNDSPFICGRVSGRHTYPFKDESGQSWNVFINTFGGGDWAYAVHPQKQKGQLVFDSNFSRNLPVDTELFILGFPSGQGTKAQGVISPVLSKASTSRQGLEDDGTIKTSNDDSDHGNSGGPVLAKKDGKYVVVGILSGADYGSDITHRKGRVIPIGAAF